MGNETQGASGKFGEADIRLENKEKKYFDFLEWENEQTRDASMEGSEREVKRAKIIDLSSGCASKHLFHLANRNKELNNETKNESYFEKKISSEHFDQDEVNSCKLTPITFSTICSIKQLQLQNNCNINPNVLLELSLPSSQRARSFDSDYSNSVVFEFMTQFIQPTIGKIEQQQFIRLKKSDIYKDYQFLEKLGEGSFGQVYRCANYITREERAVKVLRSNSLADPRLKQQFQKQISILKKTSHPNIIKLNQIYQFNNFVYIVSELCMGGSLRCLLKRIPEIDLTLVTEVLRQVFLGVNYLHSLKIIHRDIKPENIVLVNPINPNSQPEDVDIRIIDFGLSTQESESIFRDWSKIGTVSYMAPEVFQGFYSSKCDSWSCGILMYQLISGKNPFKCFQHDQVLKKIYSHTPQTSNERWAEVPQNSKRIMLKLLNINHILRITIDSAIKQGIFSKQQWQFDRRETAQTIIQYYNGDSLVSTLESYLSFTYLSQQHRKNCADLFNLIDDDNDGLIRLDEFTQFMENSQVELNRQEISYVFKKINKSKSGDINFGEFVNVFIDRKILFSRHHLEETFAFIDLNKNQTIQKNQLSFFAKVISKEILDHLFGFQFKSQRGRKVSLEQFVKYVQGLVN